MNHSVRPGTNDQHAQTEGLQALLVPKASIHRHQDIKTPMSASKKLAIMGPGPPGGLHGSDLVSRQFGDKITRQVLVKQNVHRPTSTFVRGLVRQRPALARRTETDPGTDRASRHLPDSRTVSLPARVCRRIPVFRRRFRDRCARPKTNRALSMSASFRQCRHARFPCQQLGPQSAPRIQSGGRSSSSSAGSGLICPDRRCSAAGPMTGSLPSTSRMQPSSRCRSRAATSACLGLPARLHSS